MLIKSTGNDDPGYNLDAGGLAKPVVDSHAWFDPDSGELTLGLVFERVDPLTGRTYRDSKMVSSLGRCLDIDNSSGYLLQTKDGVTTAVRRCTPLTLDTLLSENRLSDGGLARLLDTSIPAPITLVDELLRKVDEYVTIQQEVNRLLAVTYIAYTYQSVLFPIAPFLGLMSTQPGSGKSRLLSVLHRLCCNAIRTSGITTAALRRIAESEPGTLIIDEFEAIGRDSALGSELNQVLNAKFDVDARAYINTKVGRDTWVPLPYKLFSPLIFAKLARGSAPDTVLDRTVVIKMERLKSDSREFNPEHPRFDGDWAELRDNLYLWALRKAPLVWDTFQNDPEVKTGLNRKGEIWRVLLSGAKHLLNEAQYQLLLGHAKLPEPIFEDDLTEEYGPIIGALNEARSRGIRRIKATTIKKAIDSRALPPFLASDKDFVKALEHLAESQDIEVRRWGPGRTAHVFFLGEGQPPQSDLPKE